jgi:hypothetical protein
LNQSKSFEGERSATYIPVCATGGFSRVDDLLWRLQ